MRIPKSLKLSVLSYIAGMRISKSLMLSVLSYIAGMLSVAIFWVDKNKEVERLFNAQTGVNQELVARIFGLWTIFEPSYFVAVPLIVIVYAWFQVYCKTD